MWPVIIIHPIDKLTRKINRHFKKNQGEQLDWRIGVDIQAPTDPLKISRSEGENFKEKLIKVKDIL